MVTHCAICGVILDAVCCSPPSPQGKGLVIPTRKQLEAIVFAQRTTGGCHAQQIVGLPQPVMQRYSAKAWLASNQEPPFCTEAKVVTRGVALQRMVVVTRGVASGCRAQQIVCLLQPLMQPCGRARRFLLPNARPTGAASCRGAVRPTSVAALFALLPVNPLCHSMGFVAGTSTIRCS